MFSNSADSSQGQSPCGLSSPGHDSTTLSMVSTSACPSQVQSPCGSSTQTSCQGTLPAGLCTSIPSSPSIPALLTTPQASSIWSSSMLGKEQLKMNPFIVQNKANQNLPGFPKELWWSKRHPGTCGSSHWKTNCVQPGNWPAVYWQREQLTLSCSHEVFTNGKQLIHGKGPDYSNYCAGTPHTYPENIPHYMPSGICYHRRRNQGG